MRGIDRVLDRSSFVSISMPRIFAAVSLIVILNFFFGHQRFELLSEGSARGYVVDVVHVNENQNKMSVRKEFVEETSVEGRRLVRRHDEESRESVPQVARRSSHSVEAFEKEPVDPIAIAVFELGRQAAVDQ